MRRGLVALATPLALVAGGCASDGDAEPTPVDASTPDTPAAPITEPPGHEHAEELDLLLPAYLGAAGFQDVAVAEAQGWVSTIDTLGCFENESEGGMGVHWLNESLLDAELDPARPEALVYELDETGQVDGLVGHEYLVPFDAWSDADPPQLFGRDLHEHPVLPFWILHLYIWKENPAGLFADWNPAIRLCPDGVAVFGEEPPVATDTEATGTEDATAPQGRRR